MKEEISRILPSPGLFSIHNVTMLRSRDFQADPWFDRCFKGYSLDYGSITSWRDSFSILGFWIFLDLFESFIRNNEKEWYMVLFIDLKPLANTPV